MPYAVVRFESTPNPNAVKCMLDRTISDRPRSFLDAASAVSDPLATALFEIPGVRNILMNADWITVNTHPGSDWKKIKPAVKRVLAGAP